MFEQIFLKISSVRPCQGYGPRVATKLSKRDKRFSRGWIVERSGNKGVNTRFYPITIPEQ